MRIIDFHNHYYPPAYLDALRSGSSAVEVTIDDDGNPRIYYPGDYNIAVPGHRDIDYREQVLIEHGVDTQVLTLTTPGTHVETPATAARFAALVNDAFADVIRDARHGRFTALATLPLNDPAASRQGTRARLPPAGISAAPCSSATSTARDSTSPQFWPLYEARQRSGRRALHPPHAPRRRRGDDRFLAHAAGRLPLRHHARRRQDSSSAASPSASRAFGGPCATWAARSPTWPSASTAASKPSANAARNIPRPPSTYLKQFYYDTVNFNPRAIQLAIDFAGIDHILAGSDYPHQIGSIPKMIETVGANADLYAANARRLLAV